LLEPSARRVLVSVVRLLRQEGRPARSLRQRRVVQRAVAEPGRTRRWWRRRWPWRRRGPRPGGRPGAGPRGRPRRRPQRGAAPGGAPGGPGGGGRGGAPQNTLYRDLGNQPVSARIEHVLAQTSKVHPQIRTELESSFAVWWKNVKYSEGSYATGLAAERRQT